MVEGDCASMLHKVGVSHTVERRVADSNIVHHGAFESADVKHTRAGGAGNVIKLNVANDGLERALRSFFVEEIDGEHGFTDASDFHVAHENIFQSPTADRVVLKAKRTVEIGAVHLAILYENISYSAGAFAPEYHSAVAVFHNAVPDDHVFGRHVDAATIGIATGLDRDTIVACVERGAFRKNIAARFRIE